MSMQDMDLGVKACLPVEIPDNFMVLGDDLQAWQPGTYGAEKVLDSVRYTTVAVQGTQSGVGADIAFAPTNGSSASLNLLYAGGPVGTNNPGGAPVNLGFPAAAFGGALGYERSNFYPGGLMCQVGLEFIIVAIAARPKALYRMVAGAIVKERWTEAYQAAAQQLVLDNAILTYQRNLQTCQVFVSSLAHYPTNLSSGMPLVSSQNGEPIRGNVTPLCAGLPVGAAQGTPLNSQPDSTLNFTMRNFTLGLDPFNQPPAQLTSTTPLIVEIELNFYGWCRSYCPPSNCPPGGRQPRPRQSMGNTQIPG